MKLIETESRSVDYQALMSAEGTDTARGEAIPTQDGKRESLGASSATAIVEKRRSIVMGSFTVEGVNADASHFRIGAYVVAQKIQGAASYGVYCDNFNDFAYYGSSLSFGMPPFNGEDRGSAYCKAISGMGGDGQVNETDLNWYRSRFSGRVVECTATYSH